MIYHIKILIVRVLRFLLGIFKIFPIKKNRLLFSSYEGRAFNDSPRYIFEYMFRTHPEMQFVWCLNDPKKLPEEYRGKVKTVRFLSLRHIYYLMTSHFVVSNLGIEPFIPQRKGRVFVNTWHGGGAYKRVAYDITLFSPAHREYSRVMRELRKHPDYWFMSSCRRFSEISSFDFDMMRPHFLETGMARNDMLVRSDPEERAAYRQEIARRYGLDPEAFWVLYAPTFRGTYRCQEHLENQTSDPRLAEAFAKRFGKKVQILNRAHISKEKTPTQFANERFDVSDYPDMQPLLLACDSLITDYSSSMWDFALTGKPGFLFVPDLLDYEINVGFYTPIADWAHPYAETFEALCDLVSNYDDVVAREKIQNHLAILGSYENGKAAQAFESLVAKYG